MTVDETHEAGELLREFNSLRWQIARAGDFVCLSGASDTSSCRLSGKIGAQVLHLTLALIEARLRELGVKLPGDVRFEHECFECNGSGTQAMRRSSP